MKVYVIYDSKYGNSASVAESIVGGLRQASNVEVAISYAKKTTPQALKGYDVLIIGAPNHMGKPSRTITKFVDSLTDSQLDAKCFAVFDTYFQRERNKGKAVRKLEKHINKRLPKLALLAEGVSVKVLGVNGPIPDGELAQAVEFGKKIADILKTQNPLTQ